MPAFIVCVLRVLYLALNVFALFFASVIFSIPDFVLRAVLLCCCLVLILLLSCALVLAGECQCFLFCFVCVSFFLFFSSRGVGYIKASELVDIDINSVPELRSASADNPKLLNTRQKIGLKHHTDIVQHIPRSEVIFSNS